MITVYLDSQDYSVLSDEVRLTSELRAVREDLRRYASIGLVRFYFSSVVVSEAAPTEGKAVPYAISRATLLSDLCQRHTMVDFSQVLALEATALMRKQKGQVSIFDGNGNWFPDLDIDEDAPPDLWGEIRKMIKSDGTYTREQRRAAERRMFKNGRPTAEAKSLVADPRAWATQLSSRYPMKPEYSEAFVGYWLGTRSAQEYAEALRESLRDPKWMMRWFSSSPDLAPPIARIVREPAEKMNATAHALIKAAHELIERLECANAGSPIAKGGEMWRLWNYAVDEKLCAVAQALCRRLEPSWRAEITESDVARYCPGLSTIVRSVFSSYWDNLRDRKKALPRDSQFVDSMHGVYAPYVDIFRADSYMAPHIERAAKQHGTTVVSRLRNLPATIEKLLALRHTRPVADRVVEKRPR